MDEFSEMFVALEYKEDNSLFMVGPKEAKNVDGAKTLHTNISVSLADEFIALMDDKYPAHGTPPSYQVMKEELKKFLIGKGL